MKKEPLNPILQKLVDLEATGFSREKICAASDLRFNTLRTCFRRNRVSERIRYKLLESNLITEDEKSEYEKWERQQPPGKPSKRKK